MINPEKELDFTDTEIIRKEENMKPEKIIKLTRKQIYDEVWSISISGMVKKYDMPYSVLWKQIKDTFKNKEILIQLLEIYLH